MWSDKETDQDCLGFASNVEVLANCCTQKALSPLTLGIFGLWGSGKTSLMKMLLKRIEETKDSDRVLTLWFNAWRYEGRDEAQSALIHAIIAKLSECQTLGQEAKKLMGKIIEGASVMKLAKFITKTAITMTPNIEEFLSCFSDESKKLAETMEGFEKDFEKLLEEVGVDAVVVFIDDLDRCSSDKVVETFETIKLFLNTPQCTFVIGADPVRIEEAVGDVFRIKKQTRRDYLEKIVHLPFQIPVQNLRDINCYVGMLVVRQHINDDLWKQLLEHRPVLYNAPPPVLDAFKAWLEDHREEIDASALRNAIVELESILPHTPTLARGLRGNPRQIKRFLNILSLREQLASANCLEVDRALLIKFTVIEYTWKNFFDELVESVDPETGRSEFLKELVEKDIEELKTSEDSQLLADTANQPGLVSFLKTEPTFPTDLDLTPYLFLAQTSFGSSPQTGLATIDNVVTDLVAKIASGDRIRSRSAARQAALEEKSVVSDIFGSLQTELFVKEATAIRTNIIIAFDELCRRHIDYYPQAVSTLERYNGEIPDAIGLAASTLLANAENHTTVSDDLKDRFAKGPIAKAFTGGRAKGTRRKS